MYKEVRVITPIVTEGFRKAEDFASVAGPETKISQVQIERGPASIESEFDEALATPDTVMRIFEAERDGVDAAIIDCMGDPGLRPAREMVSIPVLGPCETSMHLASMLGHKFSVVTVLDRLRPTFENEAKIYGVAEKLASVRSVDIPVLELERDRDALVSALVQESVKAVEEDHADVIIFGCTGMLGCAQAVEQGLKELGYDGVPVIDPVPAAIKVAEALVDLGLTQSKRTYAAPPVKRIAGYEIASPAPASV